MEKLFKYGAVAALFLGTAGTAQADLAETKGGVTIKTEDGRFEAKFGGRIHLDTNTPLDDDEDNAEEGLDDQTFDAFFRRARLTLEGKAYGWSYKFENDFAGQNASHGSGFREMWIGTKLAGANLRLGQAKPYRGMEELTSSNEVSFMERPFSTATSLYGSRQYLMGAFLDGSGASWGWGVSVHNLRAAHNPETDGVGASARAYFLPVNSGDTLLHIGAFASQDNPTNGFAVGTSGPAFAGRSGPSASLGASTTDEQTTYGVELAGKIGPIYGQSEYASSEFSQEVGDDVEVDTYHVQLSWLLTGESKPYDVKKGVFKSPKPNNAYGAWEAKFRYDMIESDAVTLALDDPEASQFIVGLNWYVNPAVRMMFEYISGEREPISGQDASLDVFATRLQFAF